MFTEVFHHVRIHSRSCCKNLIIINADINTIDDILAINRKDDIPHDGLITDLMYSLPSVEIEGFQPSPRGAGYLFGNDVVDQVCEYYCFLLF